MKKEEKIILACRDKTEVKESSIKVAGIVLLFVALAISLLFYTKKKDSESDL